MAASSFEDPYMESILKKIAFDEGFEKPDGPQIGIVAIKEFKLNYAAFECCYPLFGFNYLIRYGEKYEITAGSKPGENFVGRIFRAVITEGSERNKGKTMSLIFKASPISKIRQEKMSTKQAFLTESIMYQTILPTLNKLLNKYAVVSSDSFPGTARCFAVRINDFGSDFCDVLVLEDKCPEGYGMLRNTKSLDAEHCRHILTKLALLHAASLALNHHEPQIAESLSKALKEEINLFYVNENHLMMSEMKRAAIDTLSKLQEPYKKGNPLYEKVENLVLNYNREMAAANKPPPELSCIVHGDCWFNNVLFKYKKDGTLEDVCIVDLQLVRVASPAVELSYVLFLCTTKQVRDDHYESLIRFYHEQVSSHLKKMACDPEKIIPWERLHHHLRKYSKVGILMAISTIPIITADSSEILVDVNSVEGNGDIFAGCANVTDPKKLQEISVRVTDVITDAFRWGYIK